MMNKFKRVKWGHYINYIVIGILTVVFAVMSMAGGVCSTLVCYLLLKRSKNGYIGIGIIGAAVHNCAQTAVCAVYAGNAVLWYLPFLAAASVLTGSVSGFLLGLLIKYFPLKYFRKD